MESGGGSGDGKENGVWTTSTIIENRAKWSLGADVELLRHLKSFSDRISSELESTSQALDSLEADLATTCVGVHLVSNHFLSLADSQFVENRVYDDEEPTEDKQVSSEPVKKSRQEEEADRFNRKKSAIANGLEVLRASFVPVEIPNIDSDDDDGEDDDDGTPIGIVYKPINRFESKPLPHLIGSKEFLIDPYVGIKSRLTDDEEEDDDDDDDEEEENEEKLSDESSASKAFSVHEDSEPESDRVNVESVGASESKPNTLGKGELSFAEHLSARLEGMRFEGKIDVSSDDSLPSVAPVKIPTTIHTTYEPVVRPYDNKADRYYDNGFDDSYDDYNDSIFAANITEPPPDNDFDEEDLFLPNDDRNLESPLWGGSSQPVVSNKQNLIRDLESKLKKDSNPPVISAVDKSSSSTSSSPGNRAMNPASRPTDLFSGDSIEEPDSLFSAAKQVNEPVKKKMPAGAVSIFGSNVDPFKNNSKTEKDTTTNRAPIKKKPDIVSSLKSNNSDNMDDDEDSLFTSGLEKTSSKNSSTKLSDSFHDDTLSIRSNKSGLFESDAIPPQTSTKAIDDLFKDVDDDNDDDDLFSSYFTKSKKEKPPPVKRNEDTFASSSSSKPKSVVDDLFGDFKDDLFASVKDKSKTASTEKKANISSSKVQNLFSDSDSDSEFITSKNSASIPSTSVLPKQQQLPSKSLFSDNEDSEKLSDDIFAASSAASKPKNVKTSDNLKEGSTDDLFGSLGKDTVNPVDKKDLFEGIGKSDSKPKTTPPVKQSIASAKSKVSIFDDTDSDGDDGLFGITTSKKPTKPKSLDDDDLFSQPISSKLPDKQDSKHSFNKLDESSVKKPEPKPVLIEKEKAQSIGNPPNKPVVPPHPSISEKTVEDDCDDLFSTNNSAAIDIKTAIPKFEDSKKDRVIDKKEEPIAAVVDDPLFDESFNVSASNKSSIKTKEGPARSSTDSLFGGIDDDSTDIFSSLGKPGSKSSKSNNEKTASSVPSTIVTSKKEEDGLSVLKDDNDDGLFSNDKPNISSASQPPFVDKKSTTLSAERELFGEDSHVDLETKVGSQKEDKVETSVPPKSPVDDLFEAKKPGVVDFPPITEPTLPKSTVESIFETKKSDDADFPPITESSLPKSTVESIFETKKSVDIGFPPSTKPTLAKSSVESKFEAKKSGDLDFLPSTEPTLAKSSVESKFEAKKSGDLDFQSNIEPILPKPTVEARVETDPLSSVQTTTSPETSQKPQPPSKPSKPILPEKRSKPIPPNTLKLPDPILCDNQVTDATDGGIFSSEPKVESPKRITPGKLNLQKTLNIDPRALLPGAMPKFKKPSNEEGVGEKSDVSEPQAVLPTLVEGGKVKPQSEDKVSPSGVLTNVNKDRARIQAKRRPPTRKARREALRHSTFEEDETDNSSSIATQSVADQTSSSVEPSNVLSPSTDEEDLFGVPPLDLPPDYTKVSTSPGDLFAVPTTVLSPGLSATENEFSVSDNSSKKPPTKTNDILENSEDTLHSIPSAGFDDDPPDIENTSRDDFYNSSSIGLFDDDLVGSSSNFGVGINDDKKFDSDLKIPTETKLMSEEDDLFVSKSSGLAVKTPDEDLFFNKPIKPLEDAVKKMEIASSKNVVDTNKIDADPLASDLSFTKSPVPTVLSDEEDLFSTVSKDKKVDDNSKVSGLSSSSKKDVSKKQTQSLFSSDENTDDIFQTASASSPKPKSLSLDRDSKTKPSPSKLESASKLSSKMDSSSLFEDDDEDLFGAKPKNIPTKQPTVAKPSSDNRLFSKSKKSIFDDDDDDDDSDIFSTSKTSASKEVQSLSTSASKRAPDPKSSQPSKSNLSKSDSQLPFVDPLSNLDNQQ